MRSLFVEVSELGFRRQADGSRIRLANLGGQMASDEFVKRLLVDPDWHDLNRGFHLEYYGDTPYQASEPMIQRDAGGPVDRMLRIILNRIETRLRLGSYALCDIDVHSPVSLAHHRHGLGLLATGHRFLVRQLKEVVEFKVKSDYRPLVRYLETMLVTPEQLAFPISQIVEAICNLKESSRRGWVKRGIVDIESVAEHSFDAYLFGLLYLPDDDGVYDKQRILDMSLIHDLAEAVTGDLLPHEKNDATRKQETATFEQFAMLSTYDGVSGLNRAKELWAEFEAKKTVNAQVAHDLDKLVNLMQLHLYKQHVSLANFEAWDRDLRYEVGTDVGRKLLTVIDRLFVEQGTRNEGRLCLRSLILQAIRPGGGNSRP